MIPIWTFLKTAATFLVKNWGAIASVLMLLFIFLFVEQCKQTNSAKAETAEAKLIADNNLKALSDSTIVLLMTREQLAITDKNLSKITHRYDSLKKNPTIVYIAKPVYIPKDVVASNELIYDPIDSTRYGLKFTSFDSVRTIGATSWLQIKNTPTKLTITPDKTIIETFTLNFGLSIAQYDDKKAKVTRLSIEPYYVDKEGNYVAPISKNLLDIQYRGANLLEVPYQMNPSSNSLPKHKYSVKTGFSISVNLLGYGAMPFNSTPAGGWIAPSIGIGYGVMLIKNK